MSNPSQNKAKDSVSSLGLGDAVRRLALLVSYTNIRKINNTRLSTEIESLVEALNQHRVEVNFICDVNFDKPTDNDALTIIKESSTTNCCTIKPTITDVDGGHAKVLAAPKKSVPTSKVKKANV